LLVVAPIVRPVAVLAIVVLEQLAFGTRYFVDGLEAIGLTPLLQALANFWE
jgi:hypothetical protein